MKHEHVLNRRTLLSTAVGVAGLGVLPGRKPTLGKPTATKGRIQQSIAYWAFNVAGDQWDLDQTCCVARELGCASVELVKGKEHEVVRQHGLTCALAQIGAEYVRDVEPGELVIVDDTGLRSRRFAERPTTRLED